jgi:hypothetical protein
MDWSEVFASTLAGVLFPLVFTLALALPLWLVRVCCPKAEPWLFRHGLRFIAGYCWGRLRRALRQALRARRF